MGRQAALDNHDQIFELIQDTDVLFLVAGMGGGTGSGATPVFAEIAQALGILTFAVITEPFLFEGQRRHVAAQAIMKLDKVGSSLIRFRNDKAIETGEPEVTLNDAFRFTQNEMSNFIANIAQVFSQA